MLSMLGLSPSGAGVVQMVDSARQGSASKWKDSSVVLVQVSLLVPPGVDSAATGRTNTTKYNQDIFYHVLL